LRDAALNGTEPLQKLWQSIGKEMRARLANELPSLKDVAAKVANA
jgi:hypothetical protein